MLSFIITRGKVGKRMIARVMMIVVETRGGRVLAKKKILPTRRETEMDRDSRDRDGEAKAGALRGERKNEIEQTAEDKRERRCSSAVVTGGGGREQQYLREWQHFVVLFLLHLQVRRGKEGR